MKTYILYVIILLGLLSSCTDTTEKLYVKFNSASGFEKETAVSINGLEIGRITDIALHSDIGVLVELEMYQKNKVPTDSKVTIKAIDFLGTKGVEIVLGENKNCFTNKDTLIGVESVTEPLESINSTISGLMKELIGTNNQDSILIELRRLNDNLEKAENK